MPGVRKVIVLMEHTAQNGGAKLLPLCRLPLTGVGVVDIIVTDLCVLEITSEGFLVTELAPGATRSDVEQKTGAAVRFLNSSEES